jgi:RNA polymerase-binding transcription factor
MNVSRYKQRLLELEESLSGRIERAVAAGGAPPADSVGDRGDASLADANADEEFTGAERDSAELKQVRDALVRIGDGTFGKCIVDGGPIDEKRLEAMPWTPYCLKHEERRESASPSKTPTL